jgi:hypothetical protein
MDPNKQDQINPPAKGHPDDKVRGVVEAGLGAVPFGGSVVRLVKELLPTQADTARARWEIVISKRTNENSERIKELISLTQKTNNPNPAAQALGDCARDLALLAFWNDGMRGPLERIASGAGGRDELQQVSSLLEDSESDVMEIVSRLTDARDEHIATKFGMTVAQALDKVVYRKVGPGAIRDKIADFTRAHGDKSLQSDAINIINEINDFDTELAKLHETIRPK